MANQAEKFGSAKRRRALWWLVPAVLGLMVTYQVMRFGLVWDRESDGAVPPAALTGPLQKSDQGAEREPAADLSAGRRESQVGLPSVQDHGDDTSVRNTAPDTRLPLTLVGVHYVPNSDIGDAIIESNGRQRRYRAGATIDGGGNPTLLSVFDDRVLIENAGSIEVLHLRADHPQPSLARPIPGAARDDTPDTRADLMRQSRLSISGVIRTAPYLENGKFRGIRIRPGPQRQAFAALGLEAGDLVLSVNGTTLTNLAESLEAFESLDTLPVATFTVSRDENTQVISLDLRQLRDSLSTGLYAGEADVGDGDAWSDDHPDK